MLLVCVGGGSFSVGVHKALMALTDRWKSVMVGAGRGSWVYRVGGWVSAVDDGSGE
jgi:hypothetical protein